MTIHKALRTALTDAATALAVPLFWEGEVFTPPMGPHLVAQIVTDRAGAASLGSRGLTRTDGALVVKCATVSGNGDVEAQELSSRVAAMFPRGRSFAVKGGDVVTTTPVIGTSHPDGRRLAVPLKIPFYAMTFGG